MTTPNVAIRPGPFAFLEGAGKALGAFAQAKEEQRQQHLQEARQAVTVIEAMRERGVLTPDYFTHPDVIKTYSIAGLPSPTAEPTLTETKTGIAKQYAKTGGEGMTDEQIAFAGLPSRSAISGEKFNQIKGAATLEAATSGTPAQKEQVTGVPSAMTAGLEQNKNLDPTLLNVAGRYVAGAVVRHGGRIPESGADRASLLRDAYQNYVTESQAAGVAPQPAEVFSSYFDAVLLPMISKQRELDVAAVRAAQTGTSDNTPAYLNAINANISQIRLRTEQLRQVAAKPIELLAYQKANGYASRQEALAAINAEIRAQEQMADQWQQSFGGVVSSSRVGSAGSPAGGTARKIDDKSIGRIASQVQSGKIKLDYLDKWVADGTMTEGDRQAVLNAMKTPFSGADR